MHLSHFKKTLLTYFKKGQVLKGKFWKKGHKKNLNPCHQMPFLDSKYAKIAFAAGRPRWGSLQRSPDPRAGLRGVTSKGMGRGEEGEVRQEEGRGK